MYTIGTHAQLKVIQEQDDLRAESGGAESGGAEEKSTEEANRIPQDENENKKETATKNDGKGKENTGSKTEKVQLNSFTCVSIYCTPHFYRTKKT